MTKYYRVRTQEQWDWLVSKLNVCRVEPIDYPMIVCHEQGRRNYSLIKYHKGPEPIIEVSQMMEESRMEDYVTISKDDLFQIEDQDGEGIVQVDGKGELSIPDMPIDEISIPKSLLYPKVPMTEAEKAEFDELKTQGNTLYTALDNMSCDGDLYIRFFGTTDLNAKQLEFARAWADESLIEVIPEDKYWVKCYPTDDCYFYKYEGKILAGVPRVHLERFQFTTDEIVEYHLDGTENIFEKVEVSE